MKTLRILTKTHGILTACLLVVALLAPGLLHAAAAAKKETGQPAFTLVIDAGHGGHDAGAAENGQAEKEINLAVATRLARLVEKNLKDVKVVLTRDDDTYLTLQQRADIANQAKGDLFISIHTNSVDKSNRGRQSVSGASVYALGLHKDGNNMSVARRENSVIELEDGFEERYSGFDPNRDESYIIFELAQKKNLQKSIRFANTAQKRLADTAGRKNRGVHQAGFWVLWATSMPAVLVELDFICNPEQAEFLGSDKGRDQLARALFEAVKEYTETHRKATATSSKRGGEGSKGKSGSAAEVAEGAEGDGESPAMLLASAPKETKSREQASSAPGEVQGSKDRAAFAQRRRRSQASRQKSEERDLTAQAEIPLHTADERLAVLDPEAQGDATSKETTGKEKKEKSSKKKGKKTKKEKDGQASKSSRAARTQHFETIFKIQILASKDLLNQGDARFKGLGPVAHFRENNLYKYTCGESKTKEGLETLLKQVKTKIPDAFIIQTTRQVAE